MHGRLLPQDALLPTSRAVGWTPAHRHWHAARMAKGPSDVVGKLPPLGAIPPPPRTGPDPRQRRTEQIVGNIEKQLGGRVHVVGGVGGGGFAASEVSLGKLQAALESGLRRFTMMQLRARWDDDVRQWTIDFAMAWVQRIKVFNVTLEENGIHIRMQT